MKVVVVTRHTSVIHWLEKHHPYIEVEETISHVNNPAQLWRKNVVGVLPLHLASVAELVGSIDLPDLKPEQRGKELTVEEMEAAGANLKWYQVFNIINPNNPIVDVAVKQGGA